MEPEGLREQLLGPAPRPGALAEAAAFGVAGPANHGGVTDHELVLRAKKAGIVPVYRTSSGQDAEVPAETLTAILAVLDPSGPQPGVGESAGQPGRRPGSGQPDAPPLTMPANRAWGFTVQLYSLRSAQSWGHGDLGDLAELAQWSAAELGAGFVLINPLHAAEPLPPVSDSPYLPMTRMFTSPLYLRVEDILEYGALTPASRQAVAGLAAPLRAANRTADLIDRDAVWTAKRRALELIREVPLSPARQDAYDQFRSDAGRALQHWSAWCALAERHGPDWRDWPARLTAPAYATQLVSADPELRAAAEFHAWLQWHAAQQLAAAQRAAVAAGMAHGIIHDLAVGVHPGGADAWADQDLLVAGFSVGAPPDAFNQRGQNWAQPPWHPGRLAATGYQPLADLFGATLRSGGGIRVDHVMGLTRLWWIPAGQSPEHGAYVRYDHHQSVAALAGAAAGAGAVAIGEDLGTVDPWLRDYLAAQGILGTEMLWFARAADGSPLPPGRWRRGCMATVGTHDFPPVAGFVTGEQVTVRARLGLLTSTEERERAEAAELIGRWRGLLATEGLLPAGHEAGVAAFTVALYGYLRRTPALLVGVSLADAVGDVRTQNIPGTSNEYPNWRVPLCDADGQAMLLADLAASELLRRVCAAVA